MDNFILKGGFYLSTLFGMENRATMDIDTAFRNENFDEKGSNLSKSGDNIKNEFIKKFEEISKSNTKAFINKVDDFNCIYNKTKEIYFDGKNIYLDYSE